MKKHPNRILVALKAARQLGIRLVFWYAVYQARLRSGNYRKSTPADNIPAHPAPIHSPFAPPDAHRLKEVLGSGPENTPLEQGTLFQGTLEQGILEADEVVNGQVRLFGGFPVPLSLVPPDTSQHW